MQPRLRTRILPSGFRRGIFRRRSGRGKRLDVAHQLPALRFRQLRPNRHLLSNHSVSHQPEKGSGRSALHFWSEETRSLARAFGGVAVAFRAVLFEEYGAGSNGVRIILQRIGAAPRFFWGLLQFRVDGRVVFGRCARSWFIGVPALRMDNRHGKKRSANAKRCGHRSHWRPPKSRLAIEANPVISRETPQRIRNRWLLSFSPKPGEIRNVQPEGKFQARTGARECAVS